MVPKRLARLEEHPLAGGLRLFVAASARARLLGLAGLARLPADCALLIPRCDSVHTFWMRFPIDVVFLDARGRVIETAPRVPPRRLARCRAAAAVIEIGAGGAARIQRLDLPSLLSTE